MELLIPVELEPLPKINFLFSGGRIWELSFFHELDVFQILPLNLAEFVLDLFIFEIDSVFLGHLNSRRRGPVEIHTHDELQVVLGVHALADFRFAHVGFFELSSLLEQPVGLHRLVQYLLDVFQLWELQVLPLIFYLETEIFHSDLGGSEHFLPQFGKFSLQL